MTALSREKYFSTTPEYVLSLYTKPEDYQNKTEKNNITAVRNITKNDGGNATEENGHLAEDSTTQMDLNIPVGNTDKGNTNGVVVDGNETNLEANETGHKFNVTQNETIVAQEVNIPTFETDKSNLTRITRKNIVTSMTKEYSEDVPKYSITRVYEKVQVCGDVEVTPFAAFVVTLKSTTSCIPSDRWEYLEDQDCDNTENSTHIDNCTVVIPFGTIISGFSQQTLHELGLLVSSLVKGLDDNFVEALSPSSTTRQYWSEVDPLVYDAQVIATINVSTNPKYTTRYYQLVGTCEDYEVYTNIIKPVVIPSLDYCVRQEELLLIGEFKIPKYNVMKEIIPALLQSQTSEKNSSIGEYRNKTYEDFSIFEDTSPNLTHLNYHLYPIGIDFPTREEDVVGLSLFEVYYNLAEDVRVRFDNTANNSDVEGNHTLQFEDMFNSFAKLVDLCPWKPVSKECGNPENLVRFRNTSQLGHYTAYQLVGRCGPVTLYTDYIVIMLDGEPLQNESNIIRGNECMITSAKTNDTSCLEQGSELTREETEVEVNVTYVGPIEDPEENKY
jgi:hypothetical protein